MPTRRAIVAPLLTTAAKKFITPKSVVSNVTGVSSGIAGGLAMAARSQDAQAPVLDVTETQGYQQALNRVNEGKGGNLDVSNWNPTSTLLPPTYAESLQGYQAQQKQVDDAIVRSGGIRPSDAKVLQDMNRYNLRARARRFVPGATY